MLAAHILNENRFKGLKPLSQMLLDASPWSIDIVSGKHAPPWYTQHLLRDILKYCALDTWHTMRLYRLFEKELQQDRRLYDLFTRLLMPASQSLVHIERRGVHVHREALKEGARIVANELARIHNALMQYVPEDVAESRVVNFNPSNFARWFLFDHMGFPVLREGKVGPSMAEDIMTKLAADYPHPVLDLMVERVKWQKWQSSFFNPYQELITSESRLHTTFKLSGTVTGRLSSGKQDADKVTGGRAASVRGINLQQVPRDPLVRSIFGSASGWAFVEADYSQIELRVAAEVSGESTLRALYNRNEDVHMAMAIRMTGKPASKISKEERKKAKAVNFGFLYGMGPTKFVETAWNNYGVKVSLDEAKAARNAFFSQFPELLHWHARQRRLVHKYQRVQSPLGRIRHLPDITSEDRGVMGEAERQAINSPVQAMASDMCLFSMVLLDRRFRKSKLDAFPVGTVHDSILFEIRDEHLLRALPIIKRTMENPPIQEHFGVELSVPVISDISVGDAWGKTIECPGVIIASRDTSQLQGWLDENYYTLARSA
jgi:DNA polymerase I-like protein with 3'-5' exonuclease and polymerase domains